MISLKSSGSLNKTVQLLKKLNSKWYMHLLEHYGKMGVDALASATPKDTGKTASSWTYEVSATDERVTISWWNDNVVKGVPIALVIQYGHGTGTGGWVEGRDYINPAIQPIFDQMIKTLWKEVAKA